MLDKLREIGTDTKLMLVLGGLIVLGIGVFLIAPSFKTGRIFFDKLKRSPATSIEQPQPTRDPNWATYTNRNRGYFIDYLATMTAESRDERTEDGKVITYDTFSQDKDTMVVEVMSFGDGIDPVVFPAGETSEQIQVAGQKVTKMVSEDGSGILIGPVKNKGQNYMLTFSSANKKGDLNIFNNMVKTFNLLPGR